MATAVSLSRFSNSKTFSTSKNFKPTNGRNDQKSEDKVKLGTEFLNAGFKCKLFVFLIRFVGQMISQWNSARSLRRNWERIGKLRKVWQTRKSVS